MERKFFVVIISFFALLLIGSLVAAQLTSNGNNNISTILKEILLTLKSLAEKDHLVCYPIEEIERDTGKFIIEYKNQLEANTIVIGHAEYFCVPTSKLAVNGEPEPDCIEIPAGVPISSGACKPVQWINQNNLKECCEAEAPGGINCGSQEWIIGTAAQPLCYVPNS